MSSAKKQEFLDILEHGVCKCGAPGVPLSQCPFAADVYNDPNQECNCCAKCSKECADDI